MGLLLSQLGRAVVQPPSTVIKLYQDLRVRGAVVYSCRDVVLKG